MHSRWRASRLLHTWPAGAPGCSTPMLDPDKPPAGPACSATDTTLLALLAAGGAALAAPDSGGHIYTTPASVGASQCHCGCGQAGQASNPERHRHKVARACSRCGRCTRVLPACNNANTRGTSCSAGACLISRSSSEPEQARVQPTPALLKRGNGLLTGQSDFSSVWMGCTSGMAALRSSQLRSLSGGFQTEAAPSGRTYTHGNQRSVRQPLWLCAVASPSSVRLESRVGYFTQPGRLSHRVAVAGHMMMIRPARQRGLRVQHGTADQAAEAQRPGRSSPAKHSWRQPWSTAGNVSTTYAAPLSKAAPSAVRRGRRQLHRAATGAAARARSRLRHPTYCRLAHRVRPPPHTASSRDSRQDSEQDRHRDHRGCGSVRHTGSWLSDAAPPGWITSLLLATMPTAAWHASR
jgi:hypothetical protein